MLIYLFIYLLLLFKDKGEADFNLIGVLSFNLIYMFYLFFFSMTLFYSQILFIIIN